MATFEQWLDAYEIVYRALPAASDQPCPNCRRQALRLVFTGPPGSGYGYASFWCDACLEGIHLSRVPVPEGVVARSLADAPETRRPTIPNYRVVS
ncbi:hypothetical protein [Micromonospora sp. NPDC007220]|uniref:hypothetical protein n=1 Tax=Micromonospora sp. NPDC007220 TaxID=3154318 RepID=UPI003401F095